MGKRSRTRGADPVPAPAAPRPRPSRREGLRAERPRAPWHPFPLVELCVLVGLGLLAWGLVRGGEDGAILLVAGMALASLAGLETAMREHFSGYAAHALLLAGLPAVLTAGVIWLLDASPAVVVVAGGAVLLGAYAALRRTFRSRR